MYNPKLHTALNRTLSAALSILAMLLTTQGFAASLATERGYTAMGGELIVIIAMGIAVYGLTMAAFQSRKRKDDGNDQSAKSKGQSVCANTDQSDQSKISGKAKARSVSD